MESNKLNRKVNYERMNRLYFLLFIPMILAPIFGLILFEEIGWWMFFSCLLAYFIQLIPWSFLVTNPHKSVVTIEADEINKYAAREKKVIYTYIGLFVFIAILDLFPFYAMSETLMKFLFSYKFYERTYEGGFLVLLLVIFMLIINAVAVTTLWQEATDIFTIRDNYAKTGLTPTEQVEKDKQKEKEILRKEKERYGEGYRVIDRDLKLYINENLKKIFIKGNKYNFSDILAFSVQDNEFTISSGSISVAKTNIGSMLGRAAVGGLVAGSIGAVIGGATASRKIENTDTRSSIIHNYSVVITVNSLSSPMITLEIGQDQKLMNRVSSILTVIVNKHKQKHEGTGTLIH